MRAELGACEGKRKQRDVDASIDLVRTRAMTGGEQRISFSSANELVRSREINFVTALVETKHQT